jgi:hypothetical protein
LLQLAFQIATQTKKRKPDRAKTVRPAVANMKNGFLHEATLKQSIFKNNVYIDELIFSMLR